MVFLTGLGQDSHAFGSDKPLILGGIEFTGQKDLLQTVMEMLFSMLSQMLYQVLHVKIF